MFHGGHIQSGLATEAPPVLHSHVTRVLVQSLPELSLIAAEGTFEELPLILSVQVKEVLGKEELDRTLRQEDELGKVPKVHRESMLLGADEVQVDGTIEKSW